MATFGNLVKPKTDRVATFWQPGKIVFSGKSPPLISRDGLIPTRGEYLPEYGSRWRVKLWDMERSRDGRQRQNSDQIAVSSHLPENICSWVSLRDVTYESLQKRFKMQYGSIGRVSYGFVRS